MAQRTPDVPDTAWVTVDDGSRWPSPSEGMDDLERRLRYGGTDPNDRWTAGAIIAAYRELLQAPRTKREMVVRSLRRAVCALRPAA